jgi:signal transduction histidine kinase
MPEGKDKERGPVVHDGGMGDADEQRARARVERARLSESAEVGRATLWQALVPLLVGFALLISLVIGLGALSREKLEAVRYQTEQEERKLSETLKRLLDLQLALSKLDREARIRAQVEAGTKGVMLPPSDLRLRNERGAVEKQLPLYDALTLKDAGKQAAVRRRIVDYIETTKDLNRFSAEGFPQYRDLEAELKQLFEDASDQQIDITRGRDNALIAAQKEISLLQLLGALTGLVVAAATTLEVLRRFRQMRRSFNALQQERQFSAQMLEGMVSAIAAIDREDRIRSANAAFFEVFPRARTGISIHDDFTTSEGMKLLAAATSERVRQATYRGRWTLGHNQAGQERAFDVYSSPLEIDGEGGQLLTLVDVTEASQAEQELRRKESLAAVGQSAAQIAHEIKNPLGSIRLGVAMLRDMTGEREAINTINLVERGIEHLSKLTLDVTQFSRTKRLTLSAVDLHALLDSSLELIFDRLSEMHTPIEKSYTTEPLRGNWDDDQLRQVFVNLITNAIDAGPDGSPVGLATEVITANAPRGHNGEEGKLTPFARVTISDHGAGMDEPTRARIFEPFFTTKRRGTGLGLAIAKQIVEQHGGRIHVASEPGEGARFIIDLPLATDKA